MKSLAIVMKLTLLVTALTLNACASGSEGQAPPAPPPSDTPPASPPINPPPNPPTITPPSPPFDGVTLNLNPASASASDANDGSESAPLKTFQAAFDKMIPLKAAGQNVRILFYPGVYRETLIDGDGPRPFWKIPANAARLVLESTEPGRAVIAGSDVWTGWQDQGAGTWTKAWPYAWGAPKPSGWSGPAISDYAARRELVFVGGSRLRQVLDSAKLEPGTFYVNESQKQLTLKLAAGINPNAVLTEVGIRERLLYLWNVDGVTISGLVFKHATSKFAEYAVTMLDGQGKRCKDYRLEDNQFVQNGQGGLGLYCDDAVLRRNLANDNGFMGIGGAYLQRVLMEDNETSRNAWRSFAGGYFGWATAGMKFFIASDFTVRRHKALNNESQGIWFDTDTPNTVVEDSVITGNTREGLFFEAGPGPMVARNNTICGNGLAGVILASVAQVRLEGNRIFDNAPGTEQSNLFFGEVRRKIGPSEDGGPAEYPLREITLTGNIIAAKPGQLLTNMYFNASSNSPDLADYNAFMASYRATANTWFAPDTNPFRFTQPGAGGASERSWDSYRKLTGQDADAVFKDPGLTCPK